jgi:uncharacterized membrane protein YsdA (DUF1294 family)
LATFACLLTILNVWTFMVFGFDKLRAEAGTWRISEGTLLSLAFIGGSLGALAGRRLFRHKTRKQPFSASLDGIVKLHVALSAGFGVYWFWNA